MSLNVSFGASLQGHARANRFGMLRVERLIGLEVWRFAWTSDFVRAFV